MKNFVYKLGLLAILVSPIAPAAIITQDVAIQNNAFASDRATFPDSSLRADNGRYKNIGFDRFDSSLGELLNVSITYASTLNHRTYGYSSDSKDNSFDYVDSGWVYNSSIQDGD